MQTNKTKPKNSKSNPKSDITLHQFFEIYRDSPLTYEQKVARYSKFFGKEYTNGKECQ